MEAPQRERTTWYRVKRVFALTREDATPINTSMALQVLLAAVASCYAMTYAFSFLPDMIVSFGYAEEEKGYYVGVISSAYFAGRIIGSYFWGWLSDKKGAKLVILINCAMMATANLGFGLSVNVPMACAMRFFTGLPSGIVAVLKSVLGDLSDSTNQSFYLSLISLGWATGMIIGPLTAGYLANPVKKYHHVFGDDAFLSRFPYFLATLSCTALFVLTFVIVLCKWDKNYSKGRKEMLLGQKVVEMKEVEKASKVEEGHTEDEATHLPIKTNRVSPDVKRKSLTTTEVEIYQNEKDYSDVNTTLIKRSAVAPESSDLDSEKHSTNVTTAAKDADSLDKVDSRQKINDSVHEKSRMLKSLGDETDSTTQHSKNGRQQQQEDIDAKSTDVTIKPSKLSGLKKISSWNICRLLSMPTYRGSVTIYALTSFVNIGFDALFTVWASTDVRFNGLNFEPHEIGRFVSIAALPLAVLQLYIYPKLEIKYGAKKTFIGFGYVATCMMPLVAANRVFLPYPAALWASLLTIHALNVLSEAIMFSSVTLFINNSVPLSIVGSANGMSMTAASLTRIFSPTICGSVFAWSVTNGTKIGFPFDVNCMFILLGGVYCLCNCLCVMLPDSVNGRKKTAKPEAT